MRLCVPNIPAVVSFSLGAIFVAAAGLFHWLGPVCGRYDFVMAINVFFGELAHGGWAVLFVLSGLLHFMLSPQWSGRGPILRSFLISSLISLFIYYGWDHHQPWWSCLAMVSAIFLGLLRVGFFVFVKFLLVAFFGYLIFGYSFTLLKASVFLRGVSFDGALASLDRRLFGVDLYKVVALQVQQSDFWMLMSDRIYVQLFVFMLFNLVACAYVGGRSLVNRYALALMICYIMGVMGYLLVPAYGPFVYDPSVFEHGWSNGPWQVADIQRFILQRTLEAGRCTQPQIAPFAFVAAMPSLHVAVPALGVVMLWGVWRPWLLMWVPLLLTVFASVATGMHYGVDLLAGVWVAIVSGWFAWKLQPRDDQRRSQCKAAL